ncbi:MAG TPA: hypothetical protein VKA05_00740, partial [Acidimicrobiales bacterium]|nr:hypothetical protein [Acidimicrobiales bacterium]
MNVTWIVYVPISPPNPTAIGTTNGADEGARIPGMVNGPPGDIAVSHVATPAIGPRAAGASVTVCTAA